MQTKRVAFLAALLLPLTIAGPAASAVPDAKHGSCERYGQSWAAWARGEFYEEAGVPRTVMPGLAQSHPAAVADFLHREMTEPDFVPGAPLCDSHPQHGQ